MIRHYCFQLDTPQPDHTAYPLYAALLERAAPEFGAWVHGCAVTPVSQYVSGDLWRVSLFGRRAIDALAPALDKLDSVYLRRGGRTLGLTLTDALEIGDPASLLDAPWIDRGALRLLTPTAFKSGGAYQLLPTQRLVLQSLILKWNGCFGSVCPIEDDGGGLDALAEGLRYRGLQLDSRLYPMKHTRIPGTVGSIVIDDRLEGADRQLLNALLAFGTFSGLGIKTALGMGGMTITTK